MLEQEVHELKQIIAGNDGRNAADARFTRTVDHLVSSVYDRIGEVAHVPSRTLFDLFVIKVLYVGRRSTHADVVDYLGALMDRCLQARELFPPDEQGRPRELYFSDMLGERSPAGDVVDVFESYRQYADRALFLTGIFPARQRRRRPGARSALRRRGAPAVDAAYYVTTGKEMYRMSARADHADCEHDPATLHKLAEHFEVYVDALNEMSDRYIMAPNQEIIADKMLDAINRHRASGTETDLTDARRYAGLLRVDKSPARAQPDERAD